MALRPPWRTVRVSKLPHGTWPQMQQQQWPMTAQGETKWAGGDHRGSSHRSSWANGGRGSGRGNDRDRGGQDYHDYGRDQYGRYRHCSSYHCYNWDNDRHHDERRGNGRDDRRSHHSSRNVNSDPCGGHGGHSHHMGEKRSRSNFRGC